MAKKFKRPTHESDAMKIFMSVDERGRKVERFRLPVVP
jgi:hypothetical protein